MIDDRLQDPAAILDFSSRTVLVTGGTGGIGSRIVRLYHRLGASVGFTYIRAETEATALQESLKAGNTVCGYRMDLRDPDSIRSTVHRVVEDLGPVDTLISNASYSSPDAWSRDFMELSDSDFIETLTVDLVGSWRVAKAVVPIMRANGGGVIIHVVSSSAVRGDGETALYSAAKMGLIGLTRSLAALLGPSIRVNAVGPGSTRTRWLDEWGLDPSTLQMLEEETPLGRLLEPEEVAWPIIFLTSAAAAGITGQVLLVDGGLTFH